MTTRIEYGVNEYPQDMPNHRALRSVLRAALIACALVLVGGLAITAAKASRVVPAQIHQMEGMK